MSCWGKAVIGCEMGYMVEASELPADEVPQQWCFITMLDKTPFNEMAAYAMVRPRLFLTCSYL